MTHLHVLIQNIIFLQVIQFIHLYKIILDRIYNEKKSKLYQEKEVLFLGGTNVGKSSLINAIQGSKVAKTAKKLTKTQNLNRHPFGTNPESKHILVDSPAFGYVRGPVKLKKYFRKMIFRHVAYSPNIFKIYYILNAEHGVKELDAEIIDQLDRFRHPICIVMNKVDKLSK